MELLIPIVVFLLIVFVALKLLKGVVKTVGLVVAIVIGAVLYFAMKGGA